MAYTDIDDPSAYFQVKIYTGTGSSQAQTFDGDTDMQPDMVWIKQRSGVEQHVIFDSVRGVQKYITPNTTAAEGDTATTLTAFGSDGFTEGGHGITGGSSSTYASWNWKAGTSVSGNTTGSGTAKAYSGSVNTDAGFSIIKYIGNGTSGHTIPHHLTVAPNVIITKVLNETSSAYVYHSGIGATKNLFLSETDAAGTSAAYWVNTAPSSSVFTVGDQTGNNANTKNIIAYCFAEKQGYSKFGSYTGNGNADGTFVYTGFKPAYFMVKLTNGANNWNIFDNKRNPFNDLDLKLYADTSGADVSAYGTLDFTSNGIKCRNSDGAFNGSGQSYIYMCFAENPFVTSTGVPATAR